MRRRREGVRRKERGDKLVQLNSTPFPAYERVIPSEGKGSEASINPNAGVKRGGEEEERKEECKLIACFFFFMKKELCGRRGWKCE